MPTCFITGSGTDVGKTYLTCALIRQLRKEGKRVRALKPVISGYDAANPQSSDTCLLAEVCGMPWSEETANALSPFRFFAPLSPHLAAEREGKTIATETLLSFCQSALKETRADEYLFIEGAGGALSPLTSDRLNVDIIAALMLPVILAVGSYIGSISHSLATTESLLARNIPLKAIVVTDTGKDGNPEETRDAIARFSTPPCPILALPRTAGNATLSPDVSEITQLLI